MPINLLATKYSMFSAFLYDIDESEIFRVEVFLLSWFGELILEAVPIQNHQREAHEIVPNKSCILPQWQLL